MFATDDVPHLALDGKLGGLVQPHDGMCHLNEKNEYDASTKMVRKKTFPCLSAHPVSTNPPSTFQLITYPALKDLVRALFKDLSLSFSITQHTWNKVLSLIASSQPDCVQEFQSLSIVHRKS